MNDKAILNSPGKFWYFVFLLCLFPLLVALYYREPLEQFMVSTLITFLAGLLLTRINENADWQQKEALAIVALSRLAAAIFGGISFLFEGVSFLDAVFETMSGFTSTGSTILVNIESYQRVFFSGGLLRSGSEAWELSCSSLLSCQNSELP